MIIPKLLLSFLVFTQQPAAIEGQVVRAGTDSVQPIANARVELNRSTFETQVVRTDSGGYYRLENVPPGAYRLFVTAAGFVRAEYGQRTMHAPGAPLTVTPGEAIEPIIFRMAPAGSIAGMVLDYDGEPLANVVVQLMKRRYTADGRPNMAPVLFTRTDDRGEYSFYWLTPDRYYINASYTASRMQPRMVAANGNIAPARDGYLPTFYPNTADVDRAAPIDVEPGNDIDGIVFQMMPVSTVSIGGTIADAITGMPARAIVRIAPAQRPVSDGYVFETQSDVAGQFEFSGIPAGAYTLSAFLITGQLSSGINLNVGDQDVRGLRIDMAPGETLTGTVSIEGQEGPINLRSSVALRGAMAGGSSRSIAADGRFEIANVRNGTYDVTLTNPPEDLYIKAIRFGQTDALNEPIHIGASVRDTLQVVLSPQSGRLHGVVVDSDDRPYPAAAIALVPEERYRSKSWHYRTATGDQDGAFNLRGIPPGNYTLFAWDFIEAGAYFNPDFIRRHEEHGAAVRVDANTEVELRIRVITP